jgi:hypothetical protein
MVEVMVRTVRDRDRREEEEEARGEREEAVDWWIRRQAREAMRWVVGRRMVGGGGERK